MNAPTPKQTYPKASRKVRQFRPRPKRHDPWLAFNISTFTFARQGIPTLNRDRSHERVWS